MPEWQTAVGTPSLLPAELRQPSAHRQAPVDGEPSKGLTLSKTQGLGCLVVLLIPMVLYLVAVVNRLLAFSRGEVAGKEVLPWVFAGVVLLLLIGGGLFKVLRDVVAWGKLGQVELEVDPRFVRAGQDFRVKVACQPRKEAELRAVTVRVEAQETVVRGSGTNKRSWTRVVHEQETEIAQGRTLRHGLPFRAEGRVPLPAGAPGSFLARRNALTWTVSVRMDVADWPDRVEEREILVHP